MFGFSSMLAGTFAAKLPEGYEWLAPVLNFIEDALVPIIIVLAAISAIYAIVLGVNMARAESAEQRDGAKKRIINFLIGAITIIVILIIVYVLAANIDKIFGSGGLVEKASENTSGAGTNSGTGVKN